MKSDLNLRPQRPTPSRVPSVPRTCVRGEPKWLDLKVDPLLVELPRLLCPRTWTVVVDDWCPSCCRGASTTFGSGDRWVGRVVSRQDTLTLTPQDT